MHTFPKTIHWVHRDGSNRVKKRIQRLHQSRRVCDWGLPTVAHVEGSVCVRVCPIVGFSSCPFLGFCSSCPYVPSPVPYYFSFLCSYFYPCLNSCCYARDLFEGLDLNSCAGFCSGCDSSSHYCVASVRAQENHQYELACTPSFVVAASCSPCFFLVSCKNYSKNFSPPILVHFALSRLAKNTQLDMVNAPIGRH